MWLYQLSQNSPWPPERFRHEIWERRPWHWNHGNKVGGEEPEVGDTVVFFYSKSRGEEFGVYGWAIVDRYDGDSDIIYFTPVAPTDHLKMDPWNDKSAHAVIDAIRGTMPRATLFPVSREDAVQVRRGITRWLNSTS